MSSTDKLPLGFRSVIINKRGKMAENRISLINAKPRLNASLEEMPGQNCWFKINARGRLIEKIEYRNSGREVINTYNDIMFNMCFTTNLLCKSLTLNEA